MGIKRLNTPIPTLCAAIVSAAVFAPVSQGVHQIFVIEDAASEQRFKDGLQATGAFSLGIESFGSTTLSFGEGVALSGPVLAPGEANGPFPQGTSTALGLFLQTNQLGGAPAAPSPHGFLFASGPDPGAFEFVRVGPDSSSMSLDILVFPPNFAGMVRGLTFRAVIDGGDAAEVRLFDNQNNLLVSETFFGASSSSLLIGVLAPPDETFLRVNLWAPAGYGDAGDFEVFAIPELSTGALLMGAGILLASLALRRTRWRQSAASTFRRR